MCAFLQHTRMTKQIYYTNYNPFFRNDIEWGFYFKLKLSLISVKCSEIRNLVSDITQRHSLCYMPVSEIAIVSMVFMLFPWHFSGIIWHPVEFHGMPWTLCYFHGISVEFYGIHVECHGMPWMLCYFHGISMEFHGIQVECHGIPCDTEDRIILTVEIHGIWPTKWLQTKNSRNLLISGGHNFSWPRILN